MYGDGRDPPANVQGSGRNPGCLVCFSGAERVSRRPQVAGFRCARAALSTRSTAEAE